MKRALFCAALALAAPGWAGSPAADAVAAVRRELPFLLIDEAGLALPTAGAPLGQTMDAVELYFSTPLAFPVDASTWMDTVENAPDLGTLFVLGDRLLGGSTPVEIPPIDWEPPAPLPPSARVAIRRLCAAMATARPYLDRAVASVPADRRDEFAAMFDWPAAGQPPDAGISSQATRRRYAGMRTFREADMRTAGGLVLMAVDEALAGVRDTIYYVPRPLRFSSPAGDVVVGGNGPDIYTSHDIENAAVIIDFGGRNTYVGPVGYAGPGEMRVVIDLGTSVEVRCDNKGPGAVGAALFGVAVMAMPNDEGVKRLTTGAWSQGAALGGVAACVVSGRAQATAGRFSQGVGVHGIGMFTADLAAQSAYDAAGYGQGVGGVRGVGMFRHQGNGSTLRGGLTDPDPREPGGAASLCQGVGFGRRAYAGGGIGLCVLRGDGISALASYFAQGAGYWHAAGAFRLRGYGGTVQGRRYALGSGVHAAFGHFESLGNGARILNWGVGPAYGWDRGVGSAVIVGDNVEVQAEWGAGAANVGGRSFGYYHGNNGRLKLPGAAGGQFFRNESAYSVQIASGLATRVQGFGDIGAASGRAMPNAWGVLHVTSASFVSDLRLPPPVWPPVDRGAAPAGPVVDLRAKLADTQGPATAASVAAIADVAAAFSLDKDTPREALRRLFSLTADEARFLVDALDPAAVEQTIPLSIAIAARGSALTAALYAVKSPEKAPLCTSLLRFSRPSTAIPFLVSRAAGRDPAWSAAALRSIGHLVNGDTSEEPGARAILEAVENALREDASPERALSLVRRVRFIEAIALLATCASIGPLERIELLAAGPQDITDRLGAPGAGKFIEIVSREPKANRARIRKELAAMDRQRGAVRKAIDRGRKSKHPGVVQAAVIAGGQSGAKRSVSWLEPLLKSPRADIREAAAVALARTGEAGLPALRRAARSSSPRVRALAAFSAGHAVSPGAREILETTLSDDSPVVAMMAIAVIRALPEALYSARDGLKKKAARRLDEAAGRELKLQLRLLP